MMTRWVGFVVVLAVLTAACSSSRDRSKGSNGSGSGASCSDFCQHLHDGDHCDELDVSQCESSCEQTITACPSRSSELLECLTSLRITCTSPGYAVGYGAEDGDGGTTPALASLTSGPGTIEIHDEACAQAVAEFKACPSSGGGQGTCSAWRQTSGCIADGAREDYNDKACDVPIESGWSGYCECASGTVKADCGHAVRTCAEACGRDSF